MDGTLPIEQNLNFLNLTGRTRGVGAIDTNKSYKGGPVAVGDNNTYTGRAVERFERGQMVYYPEYIPAQAGRKEGISTQTLWA